MESGIRGCGIRDPQTWYPESTAWNPESKTLLDYITWGESEVPDQSNTELIGRISCDGCLDWYRTIHSVVV